MAVSPPWPHQQRQDEPGDVPGCTDRPWSGAHQQPRTHGPAGVPGQLRGGWQRPAALSRRGAGAGHAAGPLGGAGRAEPGALRGPGGTQQAAG
ncbi:hypothetical protein HaLaN_16385, partial [Haematococcus lacustris]